MSKPVRIAVAGALGHMGRAVSAAAERDPEVSVVARFGRSRGEGLVSADQALAAAQVVIDFTSPAASVDLAARAARGGAPALVIGSTGFSADEARAIADAARTISIVKSGNFSLGVNVLLGLARQAAERLGPADWDAEIFEAHHRRKVDAPSGTALMLGRAVAAGRGVDLNDVIEPARHGQTGPRREGAIGFSVLRGGGIVGEHSVSFVAEDEIVTLAHSARDRSLFARGALVAARWAAGREPGLYDMQDVLGFTATS